MKIIRECSPHILIVVILGFFFYKLNGISTYRVGDGGEYYALYYAWLDSLRPWMTTHSFSAYQSFVEQSQISGHVSSEWLAQIFPSLRIWDTADFNHFWFYSFLAFVISIPVHFLGVPIDAHSSFLVLHFTLLLILYFVIYRLYGWQGLVALFLMTFLSPMLWYLNKVHTELFTYAFSLLAVSLIFKTHYFAGSFFLAIASTQNPSFAIIAFIPFLYRLVSLRQVPYTFYELVFAIGTALIVFIHPAYYFFRYGVPTPQLLTAGASLGSNISNFYIWLFDPDLGLFPNWPLGAFFVVTSVVFIGLNKSNVARLLKRENLFLLIFVLAYFFINFYAHSSTNNLNSGATRGPARYALWYIPILFPLFLFYFSTLCKSKFFYFTTFFVIVFAGWFNFVLSDPRKGEDYSTPSHLSSFIQTHLSAAYSPPDEVFAEKYSGYGEDIHRHQPLAILGPDCKKLLIYPTGNRTLITVPSTCFKDIPRLREIVNSIAKERAISQTFYFTLTEAQQIYSTESPRLLMTPPLDA